MAKTYADAINEARELINDTGEGQRYTDAFLLNVLNRGLQELGRLRPEAFTDRFDEDSGEIIIPEVRTIDDEEDSDPDELDVSEDSVVDTTDEIDISMMFFAPLVQFVAGFAEVVDDEFTTDSRAAMMLERFKQTLLGL